MNIPIGMMAQAEEDMKVHSQVGETPTRCTYRELQYLFIAVFMLLFLVFFFSRKITRRKDTGWQVKNIYFY